MANSRLLKLLWSVKRGRWGSSIDETIHFSRLNGPTDTVATLGRAAGGRQAYLRGRRHVGGQDVSDGLQVQPLLFDTMETRRTRVLGGWNALHLHHQTIIINGGPCEVQDREEEEEKTNNSCQWYLNKTPKQLTIPK